MNMMKDEWSRHINDGLISAADLHALMNGPDAARIKILDATFTLPGSSLHPAQAHVIQRIPGAQFFDIENIADHDNPLPHMIPSAAQFERQIAALGISNGDRVVIYDQSGVYMASSRAWWMMRVFGHDDVCVLDGGLHAWAAAKLPLASGEEPAPPPGSFKAQLRPALVTTHGHITTALANDSDDTVILDARPAERFAGNAAEPRGGMRTGHIPGSRNVPFAALLNPQDRTILPGPALQSLWTAQGITQNTPTILSCGSGVTACTLALGLFRAGKKDASVYDGSWAEWGLAESGLPIENSHSS